MYKLMSIFVRLITFLYCLLFLSAADVI